VEIIATLFLQIKLGDCKGAIFR